MQIRVGGVEIGIHAEADATVLRVAGTGIRVVAAQFNALVRGPGLQHIRAVANRRLAEGVHVGIRHGWQRQERHVADLVGERGIRMLESHLQRRVIDDLEARQLGVGISLGVLHIVIALDRGEDGRAKLPVRRIGGIGPCARVAFGGHCLAVRERAAAFELDRVLRGVVIGSDGLGVVIFETARVREGHEAIEHLRDDLPSRGVGDVAGKQLGRGLNGIDGDDCVGADRGTVRLLGRARRQWHNGKDRREDCGEETPEPGC